MSYLYWKWDRAISKELCEIIINDINWDEKREAKIKSHEGKSSLNKKIRNTDIVWLHPMCVVGCIADKYIRTANKIAGWNYDLTETEKIQIGKYGVGGFYKWHIDGNSLEENPRKLSFSLVLSDTQNFNGGLFEFENTKNDQPILEQGSIIVFPSFLKHRVTPVTEGERISAVTWMHGTKFK